MAEDNKTPGVYLYTLNDYSGGILPGTEDWQHVVDLGSGGGYSWETTPFYYSPSARRFFWRSESGCSCNSWGDSIESVADFENGSRADALKAVRRIVEDSFETSPANALDAAEAIRKFNIKES